MTLTPSETARRTQTPPLQGRGKGWGLTANTIAELNERARNMRNNPTEPEKRLWRNLSNGQLEGWMFRRQQVVGNRIVDFLCPQARLIVEIDGDTHDAVIDAIRDADLRQQGYHVLRHKP
jgi:very-short-patch-repair endonuclease